MNSDDSSIWGVIGIIAVIILIIWSSASESQQQQKAEYISTVEYAVADINNQIGDLYSSAKNTASAIEDECSWQSGELSGNIGDVCSSNTSYYTLDDVSDYHLDEYHYTSMLDDKALIDDVIYQLVHDANSNYEEIVYKMDNMISVFKDQCSWIEENIDEDIASECYEASNDFEYNDSSPFDVYDYLDI